MEHLDGLYVGFDSKIHRRTKTTDNLKGFSVFRQDVLCLMLASRG